MNNMTGVGLQALTEDLEQYMVAPPVCRECGRTGEVRMRTWYGYGDFGCYYQCWRCRLASDNRRRRAEDAMLAEGRPEITPGGPHECYGLPYGCYDR